ncbi:hypothetical protein [Pseudomonas citronellolis]|uniref:hypothetical protein n=1 Tax=Pseudomonas citronellolis TaxID=53408 RepID=UPI00187439CB|nr:hypothetical protein [Pseudomonas humi]
METIHAEASRCHHCGQIQGWRRFIGSPTSIVALVLSLLSIAATKPVEKLFDAERANFQISITGGDFTAAQLMVLNIGSKPATLDAMEIMSKSNGSSKTWYLYSSTDGEILEPGKSYKIKATNPSLIPKVIEPERSAVLKSQFAFEDNCLLIVKYIEVTGQKIVRSQPFMCESPPEHGGLDPVKPGIPLEQPRRSQKG